MRLPFNGGMSTHSGELSSRRTTGPSSLNKHLPARQSGLNPGTTPMKFVSAFRNVRAGAALLLAACVVPATAADISGSGSTFVHPIMLNWAASFHGKAGIKVNYQATGSGSGIQQVKAGTVSFGATDKPLPPDELKAAGLAQFPLVIGGVVPVVNLDGVKPGQLNFTGEVLANIYLGKITQWTDPAIAALNPDLKLPDLKIAVAYRGDSSGTTFNWVNYLSKVSADWKASVGEGTTVKWPVGTAGTGNEGVARLVSHVKGAIGYVELAHAVNQKMTFAKVRNKAGVFVAPSLTTFQAAASSAQWKSPDFYELLTDAPGTDAWPIAATVFVLMPKRPADAARSADAQRFFRWALESGQAEAKALNYVPLPDPLVKQVQEYWAANLK